MRQDKEFTFPAGAEVSIIPVMQGEGLLKIDESELPEILPVLALRNAVLFPGAVFPITIGREKSMKLIREAETENFFIGAVPPAPSARYSRPLRCRTAPSPPYSRLSRG